MYYLYLHMERLFKDAILKSFHRLFFGRGDFSNPRTGGLWQPGLPALRIMSNRFNHDEQINVGTAIVDHSKITIFSVV